MGLLKTLLLILVFYYGFKFLIRLFAPFLVSKMADTVKKKAEQQFGNYEQPDAVKEGETIIDKAPTKNTKKSNSVGEYVDFEEID